MASCINTVSDFSNVREAVCISADKIMDACRDQTCMENVRVFLTRDSQEVLDCATSVTARSAELLYCDVDVTPVCFREGYYCVDIQYYCRIVADAMVRGVRPSTIYGLCTYTQRATLFGGESGVLTFSSNGEEDAGRNPVGVVNAVDPTSLCARIAEHCHCRHDRDVDADDIDLPEAVAEAFDDDLVFGDTERQLFVTLGQFSIVSLQRETQLLIPSYDFCVPAETCDDEGCGVDEDPCSAFAEMAFPVSDFFPTLAEGTTICGEDEDGCGCGCRNSRSGNDRSGSGRSGDNDNDRDDREGRNGRRGGESDCEATEDALALLSGNDQTTGSCGSCRSSRNGNGVRAIGSGSNRRR